jgi:hypothetical protein
MIDRHRDAIHMEYISCQSTCDDLHVGQISDSPPHDPTSLCTVHTRTHAHIYIYHMCRLWTPYLVCGFPTDTPVKKSSTLS